jgi:hypothetical protein
MWNPEHLQIRLSLRIGEIFGARLYLIYRESLMSPIKKRRLHENAGKGFL